VSKFIKYNNINIKTASKKNKIIYKYYIIIKILNKNMLDSTIELINAISEMCAKKVENGQMNNEIYQSLGNNRARLIRESDIFTPNNHANRPYTMFDPTTKSNVTQPFSKRTLNGLTVGEFYKPKYSPGQEQFLRTKHPEYRKLVGTFSDYYQSSKKYFGNKTLILDERKFDILFRNFQEAKSINPHLNISKLWDLYTISYDNT
jgi:hypothetical protein